MNFDNIECEIYPNNEAKIFMQQYHYTHSCAKSTIAYKFTHQNQTCCVIVYGQPSGKYLASSIWEGGTENECLELLRLYSFDWCDKNIESYCISSSIKKLKTDMPEIKFLVSYADCSAGHVGYIYQASNWIYIGKSGGERKIFIDNVRRHRRDLYDKYGTSSISQLKTLLGNRLIISDERIAKNKYIYIVAHSKTEKKKLLKLLKVKPLPYPKGDITYYNETQNNFANIKA